MTQYSYSRVSLFEDCPYHFKLKYIDKLTELPKLEADNALIIGNAMHLGIETDVETALEQYYNAFPVMTDAIIEEAMKMEILIPKVKEYLETNFEGFKFIHEYKIDHPNYVGYVDLILKAPDGTCMVMDFKYSNHIKNYLDSGQLHIYKDYLEQDGFNIKKLAYLFVPKTSIKKKDTEGIYEFRKRIVEEVAKSNVTFVPIEFDEMKTVFFINSIKEIEDAKTYPKNVSGKCFACIPRFKPDYLETIMNEKGEIKMVLPKNERRERKIDTKPDLWIYADSYVGKSTFIDNVENVLFLNTDGNTDNTTAPVIRIKDVVTKSGRVTTRKFAWDVFLDAVGELETVENDYEAVALDLVEDLYEHCRVYTFDKNGWEHESDGTYGKGWSMVTTEFNNVMKRLKALGYQVIYISKEKVDEITLKGGAKRSTFKPNINDKVANFLSGTVDLTLRAYVDSNDERFLQLKKQQNVFGGGRFDFQIDVIPLEMEVFLEELTAAQDLKSTGKKAPRKPKDEPRQRTPRTKQTEAVEEKSTDEVEEYVAKKRMYFEHDGTGDMIIVKKGDSLNFLNNDIFDERTKAEYDEWLEDQDESEDAEEQEEKKEEPPARQRRSRTKPEETPVEDAPPKRERRQRTPVEDGTPPGEGDDEPEEKKEAPARRQRRSR
ncbi:AAA family ATPase [Sporosarcina sp. FSL K6-5500]|uniref:AAA family ATPase n=1 Tax=Sporosarcina sp. FSL K6-5500 TaxID=2921558 RepID=UPI0030FAD0BB